MESAQTPSPLLPWEVIERIISCSWDSANDSYPNRNLETILNFSLTCRELRPRSLCLLVADTVIKSRKDGFEFCDFLHANSHLKSFVRSITVAPNDFAPIPLLRILPNLTEITLQNSFIMSLQGYPTVLNQSVLTCCQQLTGRIRTLCLSHLSFTTPLQFFRILSAFSSITHLVCSGILVKKEDDSAPVNMAKQRLSQRLRLLSLDIGDSWSFDRKEYPNKVSVSKLLLDSGLVQATIESLTMRQAHRSSGSPEHFKFEWPRLRSLTLNLRSLGSGDAADGIGFLKDFLHLALKEVIVNIHDKSLLAVAENLAHYANLYEDLERTLLRFSQACVRLVWEINVSPLGRDSFWIQELRKRFPTLSQHGTLTVIPAKDFSGPHTASVGSLAISPDGEWATSGCQDGCIILWDLADTRKMVKQWIPHTSLIEELAFSPCSQYLLSRSLFHGQAVIWDLGELSTRQVLGGPAKGVVTCAWSPRGDTIATGIYNAAVWLWDANTFQPLHVFEHIAADRIELMKYSPDGRLLLTGCDLRGYCVWDVVSGTGKPLRHIPKVHFARLSNSDLSVAGAFDPESTRFIILSPRGLVEILDIESEDEESGHVILRAGTNLSKETKDVAFSPDGSLVITVPNGRVRTHAIRLWDAYTGIELLSLKGHKREVFDVCFSPCGKYVASASKDGTVRLWRISDGSCIAALSEHKGEVKRVAFSPDGKTLVSGASDGSVVIRRMCDVLPITTVVDEQDS